MKKKKYLVAKKVLLYTIIVIEMATLKAEVVERGIEKAKEHLR